MKKLLFILFFIPGIISCNKTDSLSIKDNVFNQNSFPQKWTLVKMWGEIPNSTTTGKDMIWQEYYILGSDGNFVKYRNKGESQLEGKGKYTVTEKDGGVFVDLVYDKESEIISSCYGIKEVLKLNSGNKLTGTWEYCDGPGLEYVKTE